MRHALAAIEAPIFLGSPVALMAPFLKIRLHAVKAGGADFKISFPLP
jgi:hypothetical protein